MQHSQPIVRYAGLSLNRTGFLLGRREGPASSSSKNYRGKLELNLLCSENNPSDQNILVNGQECPFPPLSHRELWELFQSSSTNALDSQATIRDVTAEDMYAMFRCLNSVYRIPICIISC